MKGDVLGILIHHKYLNEDILEWMEELLNYISQNNMLPISLDVEGVSLLIKVYFSFDIWPDYESVLKEKPYGLEVIITSDNFDKDDSSYGISNNNDNTKKLFEYLYNYYCSQYNITQKEKTEKAFYLKNKSR